MELQLACLAEYLSKSARGHLNILGIFDEIHAFQFPAVHPTLQVVVRFKYSRSEAHGVPLDLTYRVVNDDGFSVLELRGQQQLGVPAADEYAFWEHHVIINNLTFPRPGDYSVDVHVNGHQKASIPLKLRQMSAPPADAGGTAATAPA